MVLKPLVLIYQKKKINGSLMDAVSHVVETSQPASIPVADGDDLYIISEQAYKYFLSKCTEDELWDLGFLGQSEKHARPVYVSILRKLAKSLYCNFRRECI